MLNTAILMGRLVHTPELKAAKTGAMVCSFSIAVERSRKDQSGERQTDFFDCVAWRQTAEFVARYFAKGQMIVVQGELQTRNYIGRDGSKKKAVELIVAQVSFCGDSPRQAAPATPPADHNPDEGEFAGPPQTPPNSAYQPQQQSMFRGQRSPEMVAAPDFDEIAGDDDLPF